MKSVLPGLVWLVLATALFSATARAEYCPNEEDADCLNKTARQSDIVLEKALLQARQHLGDDETARQRLLEGQKTWLAWRDNECRYRTAQTQNKDWQETIYTSCYVDLTMDRSVALLKANEKSSQPDGTVFWDIAGTWNLDMDCDGEPEHVKGGLLSPYDPAKGALQFILSINDPGQDRSWHHLFPIGENSQYSFCRPGISISPAMIRGTSCHMARLDDGACDAIHVSLDPETQKFRIDRN